METSWLHAWAKTGRDPENPAVIVSWLPLHVHAADAAAVAGRLIDSWVSPLVVDRIAADLGGTRDSVRTLVTWLAAVHDVGKVSPAFAVQAYNVNAPVLCDAMRDGGLTVRQKLVDDPTRPGVRHEYVGQLTVSNWLTGQLGYRRGGAAAELACVVGGHHGVPATYTDLRTIQGHRDLRGDGVWEAARSTLLSWAADHVGGEDVLRPFAATTITQPSQALLTAIVIMADWIASNVDFFPLQPLRTAEQPPRMPDPAEAGARMERAWAAVGLPPRWKPNTAGDLRAMFAARFNRPKDPPHPVQVAAVQAAIAQQRPGMIVVEAPMGEGKTEAALLASEILAARSGADGCFVALPTRATSDAMFSRVLAWMRRLPGLAVDASVTLAHGTASLNDSYRGLLARGHVKAVGGQDAGTGEEGAGEVGVAHRWLRGRKKGLLAQFVIATVDQVLFAGLKSRHLTLRHLGLAGKVVIIDEVHAYDVFMSRYLDRVLHWLGAYGTPVVLLSATLPPARRAELVEAYTSGQAVASGVPMQPSGLERESDYPLVSATGMTPRPAPTSRPPQDVVLERLDDDLEVLVAKLRTELASGGCAVVVRNTVRRVQVTAERLVAEFGEDRVTVTHSRFLACDRARLDAELLRRFGPKTRDPQRPLHIVVASQVVEQSLDVDFDLMVTDLAPVDLVLQRMGRLHRHDRSRPLRLQRACCVLVGVEDWAAAPVRAVGGSGFVYGDDALLSSAALLYDRDTVTLPDDIPSLVRDAYGDAPLGPASWRAAMEEARARRQQSDERRRSDALAFLLAEIKNPAASLDGWVRAGVGDPDETPRGGGQVRDGAENLEVLVVQQDRHGGLLTPDWIDRGAGVQIPLDDEIPGDLARTIAACALRLPLVMSQMDKVGNAVIEALECNRYTSFDRSPLLSGQLVLVLDGERTAEIRHGPAAFRLAYDLRLGLLHEQLEPQAEPPQGGEQS
jgi:CRISPR-associated endonuclease/helicase Cas3